MHVAPSALAQPGDVRSGRLEGANRRFSDEFAKAALNVLLALVLVGAMAMAALPPAGWHDPWLRVGTILLVLALASWLTPSLLLLAVAPVWLLPLVLHGETKEITSSARSWAELLALELIALGWMVVYRSVLARGRAAEKEEALSPGTSCYSTSEEQPKDPLKRAALVTRAGTETRDRSESLSRLSRNDASHLLEQLERIRSELSQTRDLLKGRSFSTRDSSG